MKAAILDKDIVGSNYWNSFVRLNGKDRSHQDLLHHNGELEALKTHWLADERRNGSGNRIIRELFAEHCEDWAKERSGEGGVPARLYFEESERAMSISRQMAGVDATEFLFVDLFCGIGGFRLAMESLGGECVFSSEIDRFARGTYKHNFGEVPFGNITKFTNFNRAHEAVDARSKLIQRIRQKAIELNKPVVLCAGFPCQSFSVIGQKGGFSDKGRGDMVDHLVRILKALKPDVFIFENVQNILVHDDGRTIKAIEKKLTAGFGAGKALQYSFDHVKFRATDFGLPQNRKRLVMFGAQKYDASSPDTEDPNLNLSRLKDITHSEHWQKYRNSEKYKEIKIWDILKVSEEAYREHKWKMKRGTIKSNPEIGYTLRCGGALSPIWSRHNWDGYKIGGKVRRVTEDECKELMGFPKWYKFPQDLSRTRAKLQLGNSVPVPAIKFISELVLKKSGVLD